NSSGTLLLVGGSAAGAMARIGTTGAQTVGFNALTMRAGAGNGAHAMLDSSSTQTLSGGSGNIALTAGGPGSSATIVGHSQTITCGAACGLLMTGAAGASGATADALAQNLSGAQSVSAGRLILTGAQQFSTVGIQNE